MKSTVARNRLGCGRAPAIDPPGEREAACWCALCKDVTSCRAGDRTHGSPSAPSPRWWQHLPAPLLAGGGEGFSGSFGWSLSVASPQVPSHSLSRAPPASHTPEPEKVLAHVGLEPAFVSLFSPCSHSAPLLFFQKWAKCPGVTVLQPLTVASKPQTGTCWWF